MPEVSENLTVQEGPVKPQLTPTELVVQDDSEFAMLFDSARFNQAWRAASMFSNSKLVPADFRGSPESCFVAMHMAVRLNLDPMMVMQKTYIIHGRPGMEAQLIIALVNARGPFRGPIQWEAEGEGDNRKWTAFAIHKTTGERCEATVTWDMVKAEGWAGKTGSKWLTIPDLMGRYRSATFLARLYCPEVTMGLSTVDELQDMETIEAEIVTLPAEPRVPQTEKVKEKIKRTRKPQEDPASEVATEGQGEPEVHASEPSEAIAPTGTITHEQAAELKNAPEDLLVKAYKSAKVDWRPIAELDTETAGKIIGYLRLL